MKEVLISFMSIKLNICFLLCWFASVAAAQQNPTADPVPDPPPALRSGTIIGTVTDVQGDVVPGATVVLQASGAAGQQKATTSPSGFFSFTAVQPGIPWQLTIHATGFADWTSSAIQLAPGDYKDLGSIPLTISVEATTVTAALPETEIATEQVHIAEKQRALGVLPEFYAVYSAHPVPLTPKLKFSLAWRTASDSVTVVAAAFIAGIDQAADSPAYVEGAKGYGQRFGSEYANGVTDVFIAGAVLPSLLHQDPRYFYQGTGSRRSRIFHAVRNPFVCKGDNGRWQPNFSSLGGYLASGAIANTYYPASSRGAGLVFSTAAVDVGADMLSSLIQEFLVHRSRTPRSQR